MRIQGKIVHWKDAQGFGFIAPDAGGEQVFFHLSSFASRQRRPEENDLVTFEVGADDKGRPRAKHVLLADDGLSSLSSSARRSLYFIAPAAFLMILAGIGLSGRLPMAIVGLYLIASGIAYVAYAFDKSAAQKGKWRTQESTLHLLALVGGWPGALVAQKRLRHKTRKLSFQLVFWVTVALNCGVLVWALSPSGSGMVRSGLDAVGSVFNAR